MANKFDISILVDLQNGDKAVALWATDYKIFDRYFADRYDLMEYFDETFEAFDFKGVDRELWWDYWASQGNMLWYLSGPFHIETEESMAQFMNKWADDLDGLVRWVNRNKVPLSFS